MISKKEANLKIYTHLIVILHCSRAAIIIANSYTAEIACWGRANWSKLDAKLDQFSSRRTKGEGQKERKGKRSEQGWLKDAQAAMSGQALQ